MRKFLLSSIATACILGMVACGKKNNIEEAHKIVEEEGDKIEVANMLASDSIVMDSLDTEHMAQLEECLQYIRGTHDQLEPEVKEKIDVVIQEKINNNLDTKGTTVGGELVDNPDSEQVPSSGDE